MTREELIAEAKTWLGTPYHHYADIKGVGVDCAMILVRLFAGKCGVPADLDPRPYPADWHLNKSDERYIGWLVQYGVEVATPQPGDVAVWRFGRAFSHGGVIIDNAGNVLHSYRSLGCVITNIKEAPLKGRPVKYYSVFKD